MGKAARWFRNLLGHKKPSDSSLSSSQRSSTVQEKRRWSFVRSHHKSPIATIDGGAADRLSEKDHNATGVRHTVEISASRRKRGLDEAESAAVVIQSAFRGYLARRALRALKGLVKIQAMVRGYIVRKKRTAEWLSQMQALLRAQARARKDRAEISTSSSQSSSKFYLLEQHHPGPITSEKLEPMYRAEINKSGCSSKLSQNWSDGSVDRKLWDQRGMSLGSSCLGEDDTGAKILEVNNRNMRSGNIVATSCHLQRTSCSFTSLKDSSFGKVQSAAFPVGFSQDDIEGESEFLTANNSPQFYSTMSRSQNSRRSTFTPSRSEDSRSFYGMHLNYPNYMSYTESSRAKVRSASAPKQRPYFGKSGSAKRNSMHGLGVSRSASQKSSTVLTSFAKKGYPGSGGLDRYGMPNEYFEGDYAC